MKLPIASLLAAAACIGAGTIAAREAFARGAEPQSLLVVRFAIAGTLFAIMLPWLLAHMPRPVPWASLGLSALAGVILVAGAWGEFEGLARLPAAVLVVLIYIAPVWVALIERIAYGRRFTIRETMATAVVLGGIVLIAAPVDANASFDLLGLMLGLAASVSVAVFLVLMERIQVVLPTTLSIAVAILAGALVGVALDPGALGKELGSAEILPYAAAIGIAVWAWGLLAMIGLRAATASTAAIISASEPVFVAVLALAILGEVPATHELIGGAAVMVGVLIVSTGPTPRRMASAPVP